MHHEPLTITIDPDSELGRALAESGEEPVVLLQGTNRFRVVRERVSPRADDELWANYDPEKLREALYEIAGTISPEEGERMKELIYRGREEGTRSIDRP